MITASGRSPGEGNRNPLQYSRLENPRDGGAWWAAVYEVAQSRTRLKRLSSSSSSMGLIVLSWWLSSKRIHLQCRSYRRYGFDPWVGKIPWRRKSQPTPVFLPGKSHGQRGLKGITEELWIISKAVEESCLHFFLSLFSLFPPFFLSSSLASFTLFLLSLFFLFSSFISILWKLISKIQTSDLSNDLNKIKQNHVSI